MLDLLVTNGRVVTPHGAGAWDVAGGVEPHTHLAHRITMHPDEELFTLGPEDDSRGKVIVERGTLHGGLGDRRLVTRKIDPVMLRRPAC